MKKVLMMLFLLVSIGASYAQNKEVETDVKKAKLDFLALTLAVDASSISGESPEYENVFGGQFGIRIPVAKLDDNSDIRMGAEFSMQGGKRKSSDYMPGGNYGTSSSTARLNYLNFPVVFHYQKQPTGFFAEAGIQPGLLLSAKEKDNNIKDNLKKFDVGIPLGVGYQFKPRFGIGVSITPGLMNINKSEEYKSRNMVASFRASYSL